MLNTFKTNVNFTTSTMIELLLIIFDFKHSGVICWVTLINIFVISLYVSFAHLQGNYNIGLS